MAEKPIAQYKEYADWGPEHEIQGRKREETLAPRKCVQMGDSDGSSSAQPSENDLRKFWYDSERCFVIISCLFLATDICCYRNMSQEIIPKHCSDLEGEISAMSDSEASFRLILTNQF
jgi:hypothetical protein